MTFPATFTDQMGNQIRLEQAPKRIVSLVPSQTELLFDLGLESRVVGLTKFCIHPADKLKQKTIIGGTKNFHLDRIDELQPDLIIGNKEENYLEGIIELQQKYPVWMSDIFTLEDALTMIIQVGELTNTEEVASRMASNIRTEFEQLKHLPQTLSTAYFIWRKPYMAVGSDTIIDHVLGLCGFSNAFNSLTRYPEVSPTLLKDTNPRLILLSSEPYPFKEKHINEFQELCPSALVKVVDGEMFSWYGSRLLKAPAYLQSLINEIQESLT